MDRLIQLVTDYSKMPLFGVYTFILGTIITVIVSYLFYRKANKIKQPRIVKRSISLIRNYQSKLSKLRVSYNDEPVERLTITRIAFWNDGKSTITKNDIATMEPIAIKTFENHRILDFELVHIIEPTNNIRLVNSVDENKLIIDFEYLDKNQGCIIDVYHNGYSSSDIRLVGKLKGCKIIEGKYLPTIVSLGRFLTFKSSTMKLILGYMTIVMGMLFFLSNSLKYKSTSDFIIGLVSGIFYVYFGYVIIKRKVPKSFKRFEEDII